MPQRFDLYQRLEPDPQRRSLAEGFASCVADPLWFLARQWQMGEHQGENASSPVLVTFEAIETKVGPSAKLPHLDPQVIPAEAIVEGEPDDWWTMGRRIRLGPLLASRIRLVLDTASSEAYLFHDPPPPYDIFDRRFDGLAIWQARASLDPDGTRFAGLGIPSTRVSLWNPEELVFGAKFPLAADHNRELHLPRHHGGRVDWFSADSTSDVDAPAFDPVGNGTRAHAYPTPLQYPGAPRSRWWEIEDAAVDIGGYPPDTSHFPTTLLIDLIASHSDDWFLFPVDGHVGRLLTLKKKSVTVIDAFGDTYTLTTPKDDWSLYRTQGLESDSLMVWLRAVSPLYGECIEQVLLGKDEYTNVLWAVERRIDGRDITVPDRTPSQEATNPTLARPSRETQPEGQKRFVYVPGKDAAAHWHPYKLEDQPRSDGQPTWRYVQRRMVDLERLQPELLPAANAHVLQRFTEGGKEAVHEINPATVPGIGMMLERRYMLTRDVMGKPVIWLRRQRTPFLAPPGRAVRFDVMAEDGTS